VEINVFHVLPHVKLVQEAQLIVLVAQLDLYFNEILQYVQPPVINLVKLALVIHINVQAVLMDTISVVMYAYHALTNAMVA